MGTGHWALTGRKEPKQEQVTGKLSCVRAGACSSFHSHPRWGPLEGGCGQEGKRLRTERNVTAEDGRQGQA